MFDYKLATHDWPRDEECVVIRYSPERGNERYDYASASWVRDDEAWWRHVMNDNSNEDLTEDEAMDIIRRFSGGGR